MCKLINLLNKKWGDKNPPQAEAPRRKQSSRKAGKRKIVGHW